MQIEDERTREDFQEFRREVLDRLAAIERTLTAVGTVAGQTQITLSKFGRMIDAMESAEIPPIFRRMLGLPDPTPADPKPSRRDRKRSKEGEGE